MTRPPVLTISTLVGCLVAVVVCFVAGGATGTGVLAGFLLGAALGLACLDALRRTARVRPEWAFHAYVLSMGAKLVVMVGATLVLRYAEHLGERVDWRSFLIAYVGASLIVLLVGTPAAVRAAQREIAHS
jgi:hypothetical protein